MKMLAGWGIVLVAILSLSGAAWGASYTLLPLKDAHVFSLWPDTNYGSEPAHATGCDYGYWLIRLYLGFDLGSLPDGEVITSARLHMYHFLGMGYGATGVHVHHLADDSWQEGLITWNTRPDPDVSLSPEISYNPAAGHDFPAWMEWDLLEGAGWDPALDQADKTLSLLLKESEGGDQGHNYYSREYADDPSLQPWLEVTTAQVPLPAGIWLLGSGLIGVIGFGRPPRRRTRVEVLQ